jgi:Holliday junction DNA helicase RuvA
LISRIKGRLLRLGENRCELGCGFFIYEVLVPGYVQERLRKELGKKVELFIHYYMEGMHTGSAIPRMVGFLSEPEREFFMQFIKVPKLGERTAIRALVAPVSRVAKAIESEDRLALAELPGIGPRTAEKIIAELKGKLQAFLGAEVLEPEMHTGALSEMEEEARAVLLQLGYKPVEAERLVRSAGASFTGINSSEDLLKAVFQQSALKSRVEVKR